MSEPTIHAAFGNKIRYENGRQVPLDVALAEARRLRNREMDRLLRAAGRRVATLLLSAFGPMFGWNRRQIDPRLRHDRQASLNTYVKALRADANPGGNDRLFGHNV